MRIAYIAAGAAGMYCGSCLRDNTLAAALLSQGHEVALIPTYTPLRTDEFDVTIDRIFYGAINVYLQQKSALFRHTPALVDWLLNRPGLLRWVSRFSGSTDASDLGPLTLSMLQGAEGKQHKELAKLLDWLADFRPEIVQLTNAMFLGLARDVKRRFGVPVVCGLTGEDLFLEDLKEPFKSMVHQELRQRAQDADGFIATSRYYAEIMKQYLGVDGGRMHVVPLGINLEDYEGLGHKQNDSDGLIIGYLARICPEKGLHLLVEAFRQLVDRVGPGRVKLVIAGYLGARDQAYCDSLMQQVKEWQLDGSVELLGEVDRHEKLDFLRRIDVLSVPTTYQEPKGIYVLEALAAGVPVVEPRHGAFPELVEATGGGLLVEPESPEALAEGLERLLRSGEQRREMGRRGQAVIRKRFHDGAMAEATLAVYRKLTTDESPAPKRVRSSAGSGDRP